MEKKDKEKVEQEHVASFNTLFDKSKEFNFYYLKNSEEMLKNLYSAAIKLDGVKISEEASHRFSVSE